MSEEASLFDSHVNEFSFQHDLDANYNLTLPQSPVSVFNVGFALFSANVEVSSDHKADLH